MNLSGQQRQQLQEALIDAFPDKASLERMLFFELSKNLGVIASEGNLSQIVFQLIKTAQAENWVEDLIDGARRANSGNQKLKDVAELIGEDSQVQIGIPQNLPYSGVEQFVGREDKLELLHQGLTDCQQVVITAIAGMGGIGKTELALQYALRYQDNYPGGLCWLQVRGKELGVQIIDFARERINVNPPDDFELQGQVNYCWSYWKEGTALIVLDDVPKYGDFYRENILPYLPPAQSRFKVLMTSRQRPDRGIRGIDLNLLDPEAALELLKALAGEERIEGEIEAAQALCKWLGYLPLGLELLGRYLDNHPTLTLVKALSRLESKRLAARALLQQEYGNMTAELGVAAAFELSWVELDEEAQQLSCLLSLFASVPFDWQLVEQCLPDNDEEDLEEIRDGYLLKFNLLQLTSQHTYRIHPLVREFLQAKLAQSESALQLKQAFTRVMAAIAKKIPHIPTRSDIDLVKDNIPHLAEVAENYLDAVKDENLYSVFLGLGLFYEGQGLYTPAQTWSEQCVSEIKSRLGENHLDYGRSLNALAGSYRKQGKYVEAEPLYIQTLEIHKQQLEENYPYTAQTLNNLAILYWQQGKYVEAEPLYIKALEIRKQQLGENHPHIAGSLNNLALLYWKQGKYVKAESLYIQALEIKKQQLGENHPDTAISLNNLAILYWNQGKYVEAEPLYIQALEIRKQQLGENHPHTADSLECLALLYFDQGKYVEAEPLYIQTLDIRKQQQGENHPDTAHTLNNLGEFYTGQEKYNKAELFLTQALDIRKQQLGNNHPDTAETLNALGVLYTKQGKHSEAEKFLNQALAIAQRVLGSDHPNTVKYRENLERSNE